MASFNLTSFLAGCLFNVHSQEGFIELIYFVVNPNYVKLGLGSQIMTRLKKFAADAKINSIVTYADNRATSFFAKNGF